MAKCFTLYVFLPFVFCAQAQAMRIVIDPGHGGTDRGATQGAMSESTITLAVANELKNQLANDHQFEVSLTRTTDTYVSLEQRTKIANSQSDVFISIHVNSNSDPKARGKEIYFQNQLDSDEESLFLANIENSEGSQNPTHIDEARSVSFALQGHGKTNPDVRSIVEDLERNYRLKMSGLLTEELHHNWGGDAFHRKQSIRQAPFYVISNVTKPAALIEIGFLTNPTEAKKLVEPAYQRRIAHGIYEALLKFKEVVDKGTAQHLN
jgi:N-acetylmuramoyl-L-alanine amidase